MTTWIWIWLGIIVVSIVIEAGTMELISCWCIIGAIAALILASCNVPVVWQWLAFSIISIIMLLSFRKIALKYFLKTNEKTNADSACGKTTELLTDIKKNENGTIKINGIIWNATTKNNMELPAGTTVKLINIEGNKYIVEKIENKEN